MRSHAALTPPPTHTLYSLSHTHIHTYVYTHYTHMRTHTHTHTHTDRRTLEKEAAAAVKTTGEPTRQANSSSSSSSNGGSSTCSSSTLAPPTENGSIRRSMKSLSGASSISSSSSATSSTVETRTHPQKRVGRSEDTRTVAASQSQPPPSQPPSVDIKSLINQVGKDVRRTDKNHPYYKGENNINTKTLMWVEWLTSARAKDSRVMCVRLCFMCSNTFMWLASGGCDTM